MDMSTNVNKKYRDLFSFLKTRYGWLIAFAGVITLIIAIAVSTAHRVEAASGSSLWSDATIPKVTSQDDSSSVELGVKFTASSDGKVAGIRFYKGAGNTGTHTGSLWTKNGTRLASVVFTNETSSGWQTAYFTQAVGITAGTVYVASYHAPKGHFSIDSKYFAQSAYTSGALTALKSTSSDANGVYNYNSQVKFPSNASKGDNYWVDVVYSNGATQSTPPDAPTQVAAAQFDTSIVVTWQVPQSQSPIASYSIVRNGSVVATVDATTLRYTDTALTSGTTYSYVVRAVDTQGVTSVDSSAATIVYTTSTTPPPSGRVYPLHTNINATTFWVGEQFQSTSDGSQVCSAYDSQWQYSFFHLKKGTNTAPGCKGAPTGGCDALLKNSSGKCNDTNSIGSLRTPSNGYFPAGLPPIYENPFYLDLPYDDYNQSDSTDITGYATRCADIPWANDPGYAGHCTDKSFSYMKNRWVKLVANGQTCYGQIEDAGPADDGNGNGNYADATYVFGSNDARPYNQSYNAAGADVSPALGACLLGKFNSDLKLNWQFVDEVDVPDGPWKKIITTTAPN